MTISQRIIMLAVLLCLAMNIAHAALPAYVNKIENLYVYVEAVKRQEVNTPARIWYAISVNQRIEIPLVDCIVTVTCRKEPNDTLVTEYTASQQEWRLGRTGAVTCPLPGEPGIYTYTATLRIVDPDDPANVWTMTSPPVRLGVFAVLERTTVTIGPEGGTVVSPTIADAPKITFPAGALTGEAQVTLETISVPPDPKWQEPNMTDIGHAAYVSVKGAALQKGATLTLGLPAPPPPRYPYLAYPHIEGAVKIAPPLQVPYRNGEYTVRACAIRYREELPPSLNAESTDWQFRTWLTLFDQRADYERFTGKKWEDPKDDK